MQLRFFFCLVHTFIVSGVTFPYGVYATVHPLQVFESDITHCNGINTTLAETNSDLVSTRCKGHLISASKAFKGMTVEEVRAKLDSKIVF